VAAQDARATLATIAADDQHPVPSSALFGSAVPESPEAEAEDRVRSRGALRTYFAPLFADTGGIDRWLDEATPNPVFARLYSLDSEPLSRAQLNQLLVLSGEAGVSPGFFEYYWLSAPEHPYEVRGVPGFSGQWVTSQGKIRSLAHLKWGLYRFYVDALMYFGNVQSAYRYLRDLSLRDIERLYVSLRVDTEALGLRGPPLKINSIPRDDRYLISEMACKSWAPLPDAGPEVMEAVKRAYAEHTRIGGRAAVIRDLLSEQYLGEDFSEKENQFQLSLDEVLDQEVKSEEELTAKLGAVLETFTRARQAALANTELYLSMVEELDVYVATSMRTRQDFREMADFCDYVFAQSGLPQINVRYFDPTLSAAEGHEDKGLIECLMVKCAKVLVYYAGSKESYGKDAEAAMALSLGKPVIFFCSTPASERFYRDVHPLTRLIDFQSGVAVGAMVTRDRDVVAELLARTFENRMEYMLDQAKPGRLRLIEKLTSSVVRLQTNEPLLRETLFNYYHRTGRSGRFPGVGAPHLTLRPASPPPSA
jgi:hypothetical protein